MTKGLPFWFGVLATAIAIDLGVMRWADPIARVVKARHGFFDTPTPLEPDRVPIPVADSLVAVGPEGTRYILGTPTATGASIVARSINDDLLWEMPARHPIVLFPHPAGGTLLGVQDQRLFAADAATGELRWTIIANDKPDEMDTPYAHYSYRWDIRSFAINSRGELCSAGRFARCHGPDGTVLWKSAEEVGWGSSISRTGVLVTLRPPFLFFMSDAGVIRNRVRHDGMSASAPVIDDPRQTVWAVTRGGVTAFSLDGTERQHVDLPGDGPFSHAVSDDGTVYAATGGLVAVSSAGDVRWQFRPKDYLRTTAIDLNGDVLTTGLRRMYALRPDGTVRWRAAVTGSATVDPVIISARPEGVYFRSNRVWLIPRPAEERTP